MFGSEQLGYARFDSLAELRSKLCCCFTADPSRLESACQWVAGLETLSALLSIAGALAMVAFRMEVEPIYSTGGILYAGMLLPLVAIMLSGVRQENPRRMLYYLCFKFVSVPIIVILWLVFAFLAPHLQHKYHQSHPNAEYRRFDLSWARFYKFYPAFLSLLIVYSVLSIWYIYVVMTYRRHCLAKILLKDTNKTGTEHFNGVCMKDNEDVPTTSNTHNFQL